MSKNVNFNKKKRYEFLASVDGSHHFYMNYHSFVESLKALEKKRDELESKLLND